MTVEIGEGGERAAAREEIEGDGNSRDDEDLADLAEDPHCRYLLECLRDSEGPVPVSVLARHVVAGLTDTPPSDVPEDVRRRVATWLHHGQIPALESRGVVEFDADEEVVRLESPA